MTSCKKHPRRGGEDRRQESGSYSIGETPPPRRGRLGLQTNDETFDRNTPAEAGKTTHSAPTQRSREKHPRRGGEDLRCSFSKTSATETPPPRRGRHLDKVFRVDAIGNTPAEAGKTRCFPWILKVFWKHPRRGGEDTIGSSIGQIGEETPPPRRGRLIFLSWSVLGLGNTPAEAGKTATYGSCLLKEYYKLLKNKIIG